MFYLADSCAISPSAFLLTELSHCAYAITFHKSYTFAGGVAEMFLRIYFHQITFFDETYFDKICFSHELEL